MTLSTSNSTAQKANKLRRYTLLVCAICITYVQTIAQDQPLDSLTTKEYQAIDVYHQKLGAQQSEITLKEEEIEKLAPQDLGHLLQQVAGITLRSYGGLGGMKTVALRGLGGEHTQLTINGFPLKNAQNAQTDVGLIQLDNLSEVTVNSGIHADPLLPVSAQVMGNSIALKTADNQFTSTPIQVTSNSLVGSFGQYESHLGVKKGNKNSYIGGNAKYRTVEGAYPYRIRMGNHVHEFTRRNNSFDEYFISLGAGFKSANDSSTYRHIAHFFGQYNVADKELPGAVILYNDLGNETLLTEELKVGGNYTLLAPNSKLRIFNVYNRQFLHYHDPHFLNKEGFLDNQYTNNNTTTGFNFSKQHKALRVSFGNEFSYDDLNSNRNNLGDPHRYTNNLMTSIELKQNNWLIKGSLFHQYYEDVNRSLLHTTNYQRWSPQIGIYRPLGKAKNIQLNLWYKESMRPPSFNELYYSQIGTLSLKPEESRQLNLGGVFTKKMEQLAFNLQLNTYANRIDNKILAIPTKNLFVWSIQNVGEVDIFGADLQVGLHYNFSPNTYIQWNTTFTHQHITDVSNPSAPNYRHQLAYTPVNTVNSIVSFHHKKIAFHNQLFYTGKRYTLNQNIPANELSSFYLWDISLSYAFKIKEQHHVKLQGGVRNLADTDYVFIRYFVMPGRNYFFKLTYRFN